MATVKKGQLVQKLAEKLNVSKKQGAEILEAFVDQIMSALRRGDKVNITGFGIFKVLDRKARMGVNPKTGERIQIPASKKPKFTTGQV
jgi:DNA-binding protein HU-beta